MLVIADVLRTLEEHVLKEVREARAPRLLPSAPDVVRHINAHQRIRVIFVEDHLEAVVEDHFLWGISRLWPRADEASAEKEERRRRVGVRMGFRVSPQYAPPRNGGSEKSSRAPGAPAPPSCGLPLFLREGAPSPRDRGTRAGSRRDHYPSPLRPARGPSRSSPFLCDWLPRRIIREGRHRRRELEILRRLRVGEAAVFEWEFQERALFTFGLLVTDLHGEHLPTIRRLGEAQISLARRFLCDSPCCWYLRGSTAGRLLSIARAGAFFGSTS